MTGLQLLLMDQNYRLTNILMTQIANYLEKGNDKDVYIPLGKQLYVNFLVILDNLQPVGEPHF
jgi:hypothetical protein